MNENVKFGCRFSRKYYNVLAWGAAMCGIFSFALIYVAAKQHLWPLSLFAIPLIASIAFNYYYTHRVMTRSSITVTADGTLTVKLPWHRSVSYPVSKILQAYEVNLDNHDKHWTYPVGLGRGGDILPTEGVMLKLERSYLKSVLPVFVNPDDSTAFINCLLALNPSITVPEMPEAAQHE